MKEVSFAVGMGVVLMGAFVLIGAAGCAGLVPVTAIQECRKLCERGSAESFRDETSECVCRKDAGIRGEKL